MDSYIWNVLGYVIDGFKGVSENNKYRIKVGSYSWGARARDGKRNAERHLHVY